MKYNHNGNYFRVTTELIVVTNDTIAMHFNKTNIHGSNYYVGQGDYVSEALSVCLSFC